MISRLEKMPKPLHDKFHIHKGAARCSECDGSRVGMNEPSRLEKRLISCVFCRRVEDREYVGYDRDVVAFEPLNPVTPGHMLFLPRRHVRAAESLPWVTAQVMEVASGYADQMGDDYNLITSSGPAATQTIQHLHIHYVPRRADDGLHLPWTGQIRPLTTPENAP